MNDRFKFRCFSKKTKKMYEVDSLHLDSENEWVWVHYYNPIYDKDLKIQIETPNAVIMQSTGLKDNNGKLIFEGDIVKYTSLYSGNLTGEVYWDSETLQYKLKLLYGSGEIYADRDLVHFVNKNGLEKVGNIYENKELLEEECQK